MFELNLLYNTVKLNNKHSIRPFKIDCMFCVRIFKKYCARVRKQNTQHEKLHRIFRVMINCCVCFFFFFVKTKKILTAKHTINFKRPYYVLLNFVFISYFFKSFSRYCYAFNALMVKVLGTD